MKAIHLFIKWHTAQWKVVDKKLPLHYLQSDKNSARRIVLFNDSPIPLLAHPVVATSSPLTWSLKWRTRSSLHWSTSRQESQDYCNSIQANAPLDLLNCLQSVIRSSARLVLRLAPWPRVSKLTRVTSSTGNASVTNSAPWHTSVSMASHPVYLFQMCSTIALVPVHAALCSAASYRL